MTHLTPEELIDAMDDLLPPERQSHLTTCVPCRNALSDLSSVMSEAKRDSVPEPSPLFWQHFSQRVRTAIDDDAVSMSRWPAWLRWQVLVPIGAVATIVLALMMALPKNDPTEDETLAPQAPQALEAPQALDNWVILADLVGNIDLDTAAAAGVVVEPGDAEQAVLQLTAEEQQELTRLLRAELTRAKS